MKSNVKKTSLLLLAALLLFGSSRLQISLNHERDKLGFTRVAPLENAPPVLAFTTVALGGFRGLISNVLWIRAIRLQDEDKYFEMMQLSRWITDLEPHFVQVWLEQAWNMAYNISVKFTNYDDRWRWVKAGISLLRDEGLKYNPNNLLMYQELAWFFQHKLGENLDDANMLYKQRWADDMAQVFGKKTPNLNELINPKTPDEKRRAKLLRDTYKMDPVFMKKVDEKYGPLEWRLPEASAIYWASLGLRWAKEHPTKIKKKDLITLHRVIYQCLQQSFRRGRLIANPFAKRFEFGPNLDIVGKAKDAYEQAAKEDKNDRTNILQAERNFLRDAVYFLYADDRLEEAAHWYKYLGTKFPNHGVLDGRPDTLPSKVTLEQYAIARVQEDVRETDRKRIEAIIEGLLTRAYMGLILDQDQEYLGRRNLAIKIYQTYQSKVPKSRLAAISLPPFADIDQSIRDRLLDPVHGLQPAPRAMLATKLRIPLPPAPANPVPAATTTNAAPNVD
jgi:hypothetical protein